MAKQNGWEQHNTLHNIWPNNCCLCNKEIEIEQLKQQILDLQIETQELRLALGLIPIKKVEPE